MLTNIISIDRNLKIIALIYRLFVSQLEREKRLLIFGQTLFVSRLKVHLDSEKRNLKLGLLAEVKLTTFVRTENCQTENYFWSENFTEKC